MQLTDEQKREVAAWISSGAKLSDVQQRLAEQFGIRLTYMEARFLIDDLKLVPQEKAQPTQTKPNSAPSAIADPAENAATAAGVHMELDSIMRPGAIVSGKVTFSDGVKADWALDQTGRFSLIPSKEGYRPTQADLAEFKKLLERELARSGY